jgi:hypothetical protein
MSVFYNIASPIHETLSTPEEVLITKQTYERLLALPEVPPRDKSLDASIDVYTDDSMPMLIFKNFCKSIIIWILLSLMYQIPIVSIVSSVFVAAILWSKLDGWELMAHIGLLLKSIFEHLSAGISIAILVTYITAFIMRLNELKR